MIKRFLEFSEQNRLFTKENKLLIAVSGGIDSMAMAVLFREAGIKHAIVHCNFSLRGAESDGDELFVRDYASKHNISIYVKKFDTLAFATDKGISVQMAARELRYAWFDKIVTEDGFDAVAVAHNLNDNAETFFINLLRRTGLNGLTGMSPRNGNVIRPLLFATRDEITGYAGKMGIEFREDSSNSQIKYIRNRIRNRVIPELEGVNAHSLSAITSTMEHLSSSAAIIETCIEEIRKGVFKSSGNDITASVKALSGLNPTGAFMFELFRKYGVSAGQTRDLLALLDSPSGKYITTVSHRILRDRDNLIITGKKGEQESDHNFSSLDEMSLSGLFSDITIISPGNDPLPSGSLSACLDLDLLRFPLTVRRWRPGERFSPLGMNSMKKISDFLIDLKVPVSSKEKVMLLLSGDDVVWVMGYRIDNRYKVTAGTRKILLITL
ncbi:MAG TPA: tRNA lysidine(34) synthetase TilS [Bacteroidales bacterium]|nr:tRNA lysidine(34) synthetase TilS [Bacteroidales bacterium]